MRHIIKKQVLELQAASGLDGFQLQQAASRFYWRELIPVFEKLFDSFCGPGETISVDRLEIDLGTLTEDSLQGHGLPEELYKIVRDKLQLVLLARDNNTPVLRKAQRDNALAQWWYYMEHGRLHWGQGEITAEWYAQVWELLAVDYGQVERLRRMIRQMPQVGYRICAQHPGPLLESLLGILLGQKLSGLESQVKDFTLLVGVMEALSRQHTDPMTNSPGKTISGRSKTKQTIPQKSLPGLQRWARARKDLLDLPPRQRTEAAWRRLFTLAAADPDALKAAGGPRALLDWLLDPAPGLLESLQKNINRLPAVYAGLIKSMAANAAPIKKADKSKPSRSKPGEPQNAASENIAADRDIPDAREKLPADTQLKKEDIDEEGTHTPHSGLILLHPFLTTFFKRLNIWDGAIFTSLEARQKAIYLLHYLATGEAAAPEYQLEFPKILCGYSPEALLPGTVELTEAEKQEADSMLQMVVSRWEKLGQSSAAALREGFLRRSGKLLRRKERLVLQVEAGALDILLDYLPWNLSLVKLPWLAELLYVEWR